MALLHPRYFFALNESDKEMNRYREIEVMVDENR
jgi:hypothetical protein